MATCRYKLRLVYDSATELEWTQTSWITEPTITGTKAIRPTNLLTAQGGCYGFQGLGRSSDGSAVFDGNGDQHCWWNAAGSVNNYNGGMPAWNAQIARTFELHAWDASGSARGYWRACADEGKSTSRLCSACWEPRDSPTPPLPSHPILSLPRVAHWLLGVC